MQILYLVRGVSGAGKTDFAKKLFQGHVVDSVCEADSYFYTYDENGNFSYQWDASKLKDAHMHCQRMTRKALLDGQSVAVSNTSTTEAEVETYRKIAEDCNARFVSLVVESRHDAKNIHGVPPEKVEQMRKRFSVKV